MDIAGLSTAMKQSSLSQAVNIRLLKMSTDQAAQVSQDLVKMIEQSVEPNLGGNIDIRA